MEVRACGFRLGALVSEVLCGPMVQIMLIGGMKDGILWGFIYEKFFIYGMKDVLSPIESLFSFSRMLVYRKNYMLCELSVSLYA